MMKRGFMQCSTGFRITDLRFLFQNKMKNLNDKPQYLREKMKSYYGKVALIALICYSSYAQAMHADGDFERKTTSSSISVKAREETKQEDTTSVSGVATQISQDENSPEVASF